MLGSDSVEAGQPIRGRVVVPSAFASRPVHVRIRSRLAPIGGGARREIVGSAVPIGEDGRFVLTAPEHPVTAAGDLLRVTHRVEATLSAGRRTRRTVHAPIEVAPRTVRLSRPRQPDVGYRTAAAHGEDERSLFEELSPSDLPRLLGSRYLGERLAELWESGLAGRGRHGGSWRPRSRPSRSRSASRWR
jgi:hypothetical protein